MSKVKLDLKSKSDLALLKFARDHRDAMVNNPNFPNPVPSAADFDADVQTLSDDLDHVAALETGLLVAKTKKDESVKRLSTRLNDRASYVDIESKGEDGAILSAAFPLYATRTPTTSIDAPVGVVATMGANDGEVNLSCDSVFRAKSYLAEVREHSDVEAPGPWGHAKVATRSSMKFTGLITGKKYSFRIRALGPNELESPWSAEASCMAP